MGSDKGTTIQQNTTTAAPTPEESALNAQNLKMLQFMEPYQKQMYSALAGGNITPILEGRTPAAQGVGGVSPQQTQEMVNASLRDISPGFQASGLFDSGSALQAKVRAASDIRNANAQFNVSAAQNLFNLAIGGQSNLQAQGNQISGILGSQLAGLRTISGSSSGTTKGMNPFLKSFQTNLGQSLGSMPTTMSNNMAQFGQMCWVAAELFGGWNEYKTVMARYYIMYMAPAWFKEFYAKRGEQFALYIQNKPIIKMLVRPLFEMFVFLAEQNLKMVEA